MSSRKNRALERDISLLDPSYGFSGNLTTRNNSPYLAQYYYYYAQHYKQHPEKMLWAGMAKVAGAEIYAGMSDMELWVKAPIVGGDPGSSQFLCDFMVTGARAIFEDMGWAHLAYASSGMWALEYVFQTNNSLVNLEVWEKLDEGIHNQNSADLRESAGLLLNREQAVVMQPYYTAIAPGQIETACSIVLGSRWFFDFLGWWSSGASRSRWQSGDRRMDVREFNQKPYSWRPGPENCRARWATGPLYRSLAMDHRFHSGHASFMDRAKHRGAELYSGHAGSEGESVDV